VVVGRDRLVECLVVLVRLVDEVVDEVTSNEGTAIDRMTLLV
jgi:hypothetical protein